VWIWKPGMSNKSFGGPILRRPRNSMGRHDLQSKARTACLMLGMSLAALVACPTFAVARNDTSNDAPSTSAISASDVDDAIAKTKTDPNLAQEKTVRTLRWRSQQDNENKPARKSNWFNWLKDLFGFIAQTGRLIVWLAIAVAVALLVVAVARIIRSIKPRTRAAPFDAPTHVRDLDIRPESLPDDIGAAALALWEQGDHRAALALLYRGLLSRLVHVHEIQIRPSSTEGDCLQLANQRLQGERGEYVARVIGVWQHAVYGGQTPQSVDVQTLCLGFADALNKPASSAS
jgi:hypothetical protein